MCLLSPPIASDQLGESRKQSPRLPPARPKRDFPRRSPDWPYQCANRGNLPPSGVQAHTLDCADTEPDGVAGRRIKTTRLPGSSLNLDGDPTGDCDGQTVTS
jgi:hypothetical protein